MSQLVEHIHKLDRFGYEVEMHYKGSSTHRTLFGALVSVMTYTLIIINAASICGDFFNNENQSEINRRINVNIDDLGNQLLINNDVQIAWINKIPANIGRIKAAQIHFTPVEG